MKKSLIIFFGLFLLSGISKANDFSSRFQPYDQNYAIWQWTDDDEESAEVQYSFKYMFYNCELHNEKDLFGCSKNARNKANFYLKYTGEFDFYNGTRDSGPVINRISNIALHMRWDRDAGNYIEWIDVGREHRSDGQVTDANLTDTDAVSPTFGQYLTEIEYQNGNHEYFDTISRGANYWTLSLGGKFMRNGKYSVSYKIYDKEEESNITWGELAGTDTDFADYDLLKISISKPIGKDYDWFRKVELGFDYTVGRKSLDTDSLDVNLLLPIKNENSGWDIPLLVRAHFGPMDRLSDYTTERNSIGVGLAFSFK